jgi:hypothetical protein
MKRYQKKLLNLTITQWFDDLIEELSHFHIEQLNKIFLQL